MRILKYLQLMGDFSGSVLRGDDAFYIGIDTPSDEYIDELFKPKEEEDRNEID